MSHPYNGITAVISTKHGKESLIAPVFEKLGVKTEHQEWDTDELGTFSGEIPRTLSQHETIIKKARIGMAKSRRKYGIASEGSIGADPALGFINSSLEAIAWVDEVLGFELVEYERGLEVVAAKRFFTQGEDLDSFLTAADFPNHALIVYPEGEKGPIYKGIRKHNELEVAISECLTKSKTKRVVIESDLRAHMSPSRSKVIIRCAEKLISRLVALCSACGLPGFGKVGNLSGLDCEACGELVLQAIKGEVHGCVKCDYKLETLNGKTKANPASCPACNP